MWLSQVYMLGSEHLFYLCKLLLSLPMPLTGGKLEVTVLLDTKHCVGLLAQDHLV